MQEVDDKFYARADAHIYLSNDQISETVSRGKVSASFMYGVARFNAYITATSWSSQEEMLAAKDEAIEYFVNEYRKMLEENFDDYIDNFNSYMNISDEKE